MARLLRIRIRGGVKKVKYECETRQSIVWGDYQAVAGVRYPSFVFLLRLAIHPDLAIFLQDHLDPQVSRDKQ